VEIKTVGMSCELRTLGLASKLEALEGTLAEFHSLELVYLLTGDELGFAA
jgi:hypothetical protein